MACLADGSLKTGSVFMGIHSFLRQHKRLLSCIVLEDVAGLLVPPSGMDGQATDPSNADTACHLLEIDGVFLLLWCLCPLLFGRPQNRPRLYFLLLEKDALVELGLIAAQAEAIHPSTMGCLVGQ